MNRKQFLSGSAALAVSALLTPLSRADTPDSPDVLVTVIPDSKLGTVPLSFTGLSYEASQLANPDFFSPQNKNLAAFFRTLSSHGVLRIGGNTVEFTDWNPQVFTNSQLAAPPDNTTVQYKRHRRTPITPAAIDNLSKFLDSTGWSLIYGLNLGTGTPEEAASQASCVWKATGSKLIAFQTGNEPDLYHGNGLRPAHWLFTDYLKEWNQFADAIQTACPGSPLAGPDVGGNHDWLTRFAEGAGRRLAMLSGHYYAEGPPSSPDSTIENLLAPSTRLTRNLAAEKSVSMKSGLPYRVTEGNSCYNGGKKGVSDTFASALWGADYALRVAQAGHVGLNFHGGGNGIYTPIAGKPESGFRARPLYYGILLADQFSGADLLGLEVQSARVNVTAYAAQTKKSTLVAVINKDQESAHGVQINTGLRSSKAHLWVLEAPAIDAMSGITLGSAGVGTDGSWKPSELTLHATSPGLFTVNLPAGCAVLMFV